MAELDLEKCIHITPTANELMSNIQLLCNIPGCQSIFKNSGNLKMHLEKHHKIPLVGVKESSIKLFFCPEVCCVYHEKALNGKHFNCLKYLRQHFQKMHAVKRFGCQKCTKQFATDSMRSSHEKNCGRSYVCLECGWTYDSSVALLIHAKRKGHQVKQKVNEANCKSPSPRIKKSEQFELQNRETQTEDDTSGIALPPKKRMKSVLLPDMHHFNDTPLCDIETQTEMNFTPGICDPMLYSNMHTQTCEEFLSELGLSDIQTQTNWSSLAVEDSHEDAIKKEFLAGARDELMVSTETQTSFTQCLLDSCNEENPFGGVITQHTQTCDTLLDGLFGGQDNDLISSFQSTHTQT